MKAKIPLLAGPDDLGDSAVFVVSDDPWMRGLARELEAALEVAVECYLTGDAFLAEYRTDRAGCAVVDVRTPGLIGLEVQRALTARRAAIPIIVVTGYADVTMAVEALRAGAAEFLEKPFSSEILIERIKGVMQADRYRRHLEARFAAFCDRVLRLTQREREVLDLLVEGAPNKQIAERLALSRKTIETHRAKLMHKTGVASLAELIRFGLQLQSGGTGVGIPNADSAP